LMTGLESQLGGMGTAFASSLLGLAGSLVVGLLELFAGHGQNRFYMELEEWLSSISKIGQSSYESDPITEDIGNSKSKEMFFDTKMGYLVELLENHETQAINTQIKVGELIKTIESRISNIDAKENKSSSQKSDDSVDLAPLIQNQENLVSLIRNYIEIENNSDTEFRARVRSIDVQLAKIFDELASGRQENLTELREDLALLSNAILKLASASDRKQKE